MPLFTNAAPGDAMPFTIAEQTGDKRTLVLTERALPHRPIEWAGNQRSEVTSYPGSPVRTQQVLGAEEDDTEVSGFWKDRFIGALPSLQATTSMAYYQQSGSNTNLLTASDLVALADDIRRKGQTVVVQWGPVVRRGILKRLSQRWHNIHDIEWTMKFEWSSQNDPDVPVVTGKDTDCANSLGSLQALVQGILTTIDDASDTLASQIEAYQSYATTVVDLVQEFQDTTSNALDNTMPIMDQQRRIAGILNDLMASTTTMSNYITSTPAIVSAVPSLPGAPIEGAALAVELLNRNLLTLLRTIRFNAAETQFNVLKSVNPNILAAFTAQQNGDLRDVSTEFYGSQDDWRSIMVFNGFTSSKLTSGQTVFIPDLTRPLDGSQ